MGWGGGVVGGGYHICIYIHMYIYTHIHIHISIYIYRDMFICAYICIHMVGSLNGRTPL